MDLHKVILFSLDVLHLSSVLLIKVFFLHSILYWGHLVFAWLYIALSLLKVSKFVFYTVYGDILASSEEEHLLKAVKQFISDLANKSVVVLILHVDDELPVTILEGLGDGLDVLDLDGPFKLVGLNVSKLVRGQQQVALLAHLETVVLQQFAREHHSFSGV